MDARNGMVFTAPSWLQESERNFFR